MIISIPENIPAVIGEFVDVPLNIQIGPDEDFWGTNFTLIFDPARLGIINAGFSDDVRLGKLIQSASPKWEVAAFASPGRVTLMLSTTGELRASGEIAVVRLRSLAEGSVAVAVNGLAEDGSPGRPQRFTYQNGSVVAAPASDPIVEVRITRASGKVEVR